MSQSLPLTERSFSHRTLFNTNGKFQSNVAFALNSKPGLITKQSLWWYLWSFRKRHPCPRGEQNSQNLNLVTTRSTVGRKVIWKGLTRRSLSLMNHLLLSHTNLSKSQWRSTVLFDGRYFIYGCTYYRPGVVQHPSE